MPHLLTIPSTGRILANSVIVTFVLRIKYSSVVYLIIFKSLNQRYYIY